VIKREDLLAIAKLKGLPPKLAELDYLQDIALLNLYREFGNKLVFKGGTCMYKAYQLNRFSEDLDFTARKGFKPKKFFSRLPFYFKLLNMKSRVRVKHFETAINVYLDVNGPLYDGKKETMGTVILNISLRERVLLPIQRFPYMPAYQEIRSFDLFAMDEREILAEKVRAIYERNKARDVYDLLYLLKWRKISFDAGLAKEKLSCNKLKFGRHSFLAKIDEKKAGWERDLGALVAGGLPSFAKAKKEIREKL